MCEADLVDMKSETGCAYKYDDLQNLGKSD